MTRLDEAFVHKMPEELVGLVFAQAGTLAYACDFGVGIYLVPSTLAFVDSPEHRFALMVGKLFWHYAPLPLVPPPTVRLPDRSATRPGRRLSRAGKELATNSKLLPGIWCTFHSAQLSGEPGR
jgi:hypothetical protein